MGTADGVEPGEVDRAALQLIAEGVTELAGFELAAISIVHDGRLHTIAIAGSAHADPEPSTLQPKVSAVLAELERAEDWGSLKFLPAERQSRELADLSFIPDLAPVDAPDAWHPNDLLVALLEDDAGQLRGVLSVDVPRNGLRPDTEQRRVIEQHARQAGRAVVTLLERHEFETGMHRERATSDYRGQLIDALSHQLQNPVAAITGNLELLFDQLEPGDTRERPLRAIERATGRIQSMIEDLLALAKVNNPDRPLHEVEVDLVALVRDVGDSVRAEAAAADVKVRLDLPAGPLLVSGDPGELEDLVGNLLSNALKYSDAGGSVTATAQRVVQGGTAYVELCVADEGIGIAQEEQGRLFEEFFRSESVEARTRPGTGLGLTVVERVVRRHRGRIELESELGDGTTFRVLLPALG
ncbi:sensor histidine kinase [Nocardioides halotolerans]|jgi:signal transduction histidine kinase|uniref:sensor histidine kinase n=1 Tax=Nocardioides halotolerans TaxID=433660 RepID=UPI000400165A|nr:HAMP domain-containing sensor histidine kinase [Nocardioides halotolerans]